MTQEYFGPLPQSDLNRDKLVQWLARQTITFQRIITGSLQAGQELSSSNFVSGTSGWFIDGDGNAEFNDITIRGDLIGNWNGTTPANLASLDTGATTGFYLDSSVGSMQLMGNLFLGGSIKFKRGASGSVITTNHDPQNGDLWIEYRGNSAGAIIGLKKSSGSELVAGQINVYSDGWEVNAGNFAFQDGSESLPGITFTNDKDTGLYLVASNIVGISGAGGLIARFSTTQARFLDGTVGLPSIGFINDADTGFYLVGTNALGITTGGSVRVSISSSQYANTHIRDNTTGSAANVFINATSGNMARSTSSLKYKEGWEFANEDLLARVELPASIIWEDEQGGPMLGFGVEHVAEVLPRAIQDDDENYDVRALVAVLSAKVKRLEAQIGGERW